MKMAVNHPHEETHHQEPIVTPHVEEKKSKRLRGIFNKIPWLPIKKFLRKFWWLVLIGIIILLIIISALTPKQPKFEYSTTEVQKGNLIQTVEATGTVKPSAEIELRFPATGNLIENTVTIGQEVKEGDPLSKIDDRELKYQMNQAAASLSQARANLNKIIAGSRAEDIQITEKTVDQSYTEYQNALNNLEKAKTQAEADKLAYYETWQKSLTDLENAKINHTDTINYQNQYIVNIEDAAISEAEKSIAKCNVALDELEEIHDDADARIYLGSQKPAYKNQEAVSNATAITKVASAETQLNLAKTTFSSSDIELAAALAVQATSDTLVNLNDMYKVLNASSYSNVFTSTDLANYKSNISTQITTISAQLSSADTAYQNLTNYTLNSITSINTAESSMLSAENAVYVAEANYQAAIAAADTKIQTAENAVNTAKAAWEVSKSQLNYKKAPAWTFDVSAYQAQVNQLAAAYELAKKKWEDATIKAPIDGIITKIEYEKGEQVNSTTPAITMVNTSGYEIEVDISESDIAKVRMDNKVAITLDAFGEDTIYEGHVISIEPAETVIQDVIYYTVRISFDELDEAIKPGMTANIIINTANRNNVLYVPRRAVIDKDNKKIIRLLISNSPQEVEVETGLRADNGQIEITEGINEGEIVITFIKEIK